MDKEKFDDLEARRAKTLSLKGKAFSDRELMGWSERELSDALRYGEPTGSTIDAIKRVLALKAEEGKPAGKLLPLQKAGFGLALITALAAVAKLFV
ncbi:hypothetical protein [Novosphingobium sp.]|uniref:hypothetical protein n=1 Tax=Novosphingobium sp. TaxID=1874826 RepID=UPI0031DEA9BE